MSIRRPITLRNCDTKRGLARSSAKPVSNGSRHLPAYLPTYSHRRVELIRSSSWFGTYHTCFPAQPSQTIKHLSEVGTKSMPPPASVLCPILERVSSRHRHRQDKARHDKTRHDTPMPCVQLKNTQDAPSPHPPPEVSTVLSAPDRRTDRPTMCVHATLRHVTLRYVFLK